MKYTEILQKNKDLGSRMGGKRYKIGILSNIVVNQLKDVLELALREKGVFADVAFGEYDNLVQDSQRFEDCEAIIIFWEVSNAIEGFHYKYQHLTDEDMANLRQKMEIEIKLVFQNLEASPLLIFNQFTSIPFDNHSVHDTKLSKFCTELNKLLKSFVGSSRIILDLDKVFMNLGLQSSINERQYQLSKALYTVDFFRSYSVFTLPLFLAATGKAKKALILDCDNTLWGGIIGEDGLENIQLDGMSRKGKVFHEVQNLLLALKKKGVLLGICSKNDMTEVDNVFSTHPSMVLKHSDLVIQKVNWKDKASNLRDIADELNIGLDSIVFVDDSSFELGLIQKELPEVVCIQVPENISEYPKTIRELNSYFLNLSSSREDQDKTELYKQESKRKESTAQHQSIEGYLESLKLVVTILPDISIARASQLSQKTNQFNLTTHRYTEAEITAMSRNDEFEILTFSVADMYGDYGITGMVIMKFTKEEPSLAYIDSFMMSCRIIGRNIEYAVFDFIVKNLIGRRKEKIIAEYRPTLKNTQVQKYYDKLGFTVIDQNEEFVKYCISTGEYKFNNINYIKIG